MTKFQEKRESDNVTIIYKLPNQFSERIGRKRYLTNKPKRWQIESLVTRVPRPFLVEVQQMLHTKEPAHKAL